MTYSKDVPLTHIHSFLETKGIWPLTAGLFEVGAFRGKGMLHNCIALRLRDINGKVLGYAGRRLVPKSLGKWVFPKGLPKDQLLYNFHCLYPNPPYYVVLVESPWSVLRLWQLASPSVALLGVYLSNAQARVLQEIPKILVMLDGDRAGRKVTDSICSSLSASPTLVPDGCDPDDLLDKQLTSLVR